MEIKATFGHEGKTSRDDMFHITLTGSSLMTRKIYVLLEEHLADEYTFYTK